MKCIGNAVFLFESKHTDCPLSSDRHWQGNTVTCLNTRDFRLPPRSRSELRSSGLLRSEWRQFLTDVSGQTIGPIFKGQGSWRLFLDFLPLCVFFWFLFISLFFFISFLYFCRIFWWSSLDFFLGGGGAVIWSLMVSLFWVYEFVFLWFWLESLFFIQAIFLGFRFCYNFSCFYIVLYF